MAIHFRIQAFKPDTNTLARKKIKRFIVERVPSCIVVTELTELNFKLIFFYSHRKHEIFNVFETSMDFFIENIATYLKWCKSLKFP